MVITCKMYKTSIVLILFLSLFGSVLGRRKKRENAASRAPIKWKDQPNNCTNERIDVRLLDLSSLYSDLEEPEFIATKSNSTGLVEVLMPCSHQSLFMCFPRSPQDFQLAYIFSHIACRQLGFMTFVSMNKKELPPTLNDKRPHGLKQSSYSCTGQEQNITHCGWNDVVVDNCEVLTEITCSECHNVVHEYSGIVKSPGFPLAYLFDVTCEWDITVPEDHTILLTFHHFETLFPEYSLLFCPLHKPYIEITYGIPAKMSIHRYCSWQDMKNLSIPFRGVKIRIFTGLFSKTELHVQEKEKGVAVSFEAIPKEESSGWHWKMIFLALSILIFMASTVLCHYCQKHELCTVRRRNCELPTVNAPVLEDICRAYEFQRCKIQEPQKEKPGLRLRSNGSGAKLSRIFFPNTPGTTYEIPRGFPKYQSQIETPKTIPEIVLNDENGGEEKLNPIQRAKVNLLNRYSGNESDVSGRISVTSSVFYPAVPNFQIYRSVSSDQEDDVKKIPQPHETAL